MTNLTLDEKKALIRMALEAREQAYAPYSDFMVGDDVTLVIQRFDDKKKQIYGIYEGIAEDFQA